MILLPALLAMQAATPAAAPAAPANVCTKLMNDWAWYEKEMAYSLVRSENVTLDFAQLYEARILRATMQAQMTLDLMIAKRCPTPDTAVDVYTYFDAARACRAAELKSSKDSPACVRRDWKPD